MDLFTYLMAKNNQNTHKDLFSYLLGKNAGGSGTYTTFSGTSLNISNTIKAKIKNFMLNSTELTQDGTPTSDNPVDVNVITGSNNVKIENKNLAYTGWAEDFVSRIGNVDQAELLTYDNKNCLKFRNDVGEGDYDNKYMLEIDWNENTQYTFVFDLLSVSGYFNFSIDYTDGTVSFINGTQSANQWRKVIWTTDANKTVRRLRARNVTGLSYVDLDTFMVLEGVYTAETIPEYVEHQEQNYPITLDDLEYCKIGDYADQIFKNTIDSPYYNANLDLNEWYLYKKIINYNGSWRLGGTQLFDDSLIFYGTITNVVDNKVYSTHFPYYRGIYRQNYEGIDTFPNSNEIGIRVNKNIATTANELQEWLSNNNVKILYATTTSTYIHISQEDYPVLREQLENLYNNAKSYDGQTNITQTNDNLPFNLSVDVKVTSVGNLLNTSLLNENIAETQSIAQSEEPLELDNINEMEEQNDEQIEEVS